MIRFVPQGDALFTDRYTAAVGAKPRDGRVRARQFAGDAVFIGGYFPGGVFRAGQLLHAVKGGQVVPRALHGPDLVPLGAEGLLGVALHPDVDKERPAVLIHRDAAGIVMVVAVAVGAKLCAQHPVALPCGVDAHTGVPHSGQMPGHCSVFHQFLFRKGGGQPVPQVDVGAGVLILQPVGVGIGAEVCRRQCLQSIAAYGLPEAVFPRTAPPGKGAAIPEVQVIGAVHVDVADILCNIFDFRFMEQGREGVRCSGRQNLKAAPQGQPGMAVILRTLVAAAVRAVVLQKAVEAVGRLFHGGFPLLLGGG